MFPPMRGGESPKTGLSAGFNKRALLLNRAILNLRSQANLPNWLIFCKKRVFQS